MTLIWEHNHKRRRFINEKKIEIIFYINSYHDIEKRENEEQLDG